MFMLFWILTVHGSGGKNFSLKSNRVTQIKITLVSAQFFDSNYDTCYSCTTLDVDKLLDQVRDQEWRSWLTSIQGVTR